MYDNALNKHHIASGLLNRLKGQGVGAILARGSGRSFAVMLLGAIMSFGTNMLLTRVMGISHYGIYIYALTWINLLAILSKLGMDTSLVRYVAEYNAKEKWELFRGILTGSVYFVLITSLLFGAIATLIILLFYQKIGSEQATTLLVALLILPVLALTGLRNASLRALKLVGRAGLCDSFIRPLVIVLFVLGSFVIFKRHLEASQVMAFNFIGTIIAFYFGTIWVIRVLPKQLRSVTPLYATNEWIKVSLPLFFISGMSLILNKTDIIMLGALQNTEQAGIYSVASRVSGLVIFGLTAVNTIAVPMISELYSTGKHQQLQRMITLAARGIFVFTIIGATTMLVFGRNILGLFGESFTSGYTPLLILLGGQVINSLAGSVGFLMTMTGHQKQAAKILLLSSIANVVLNAILIPKYGVIGAALATGVTTALWNFTMLYYVKRHLNINPTVFLIGKKSEKA